MPSSIIIIIINRVCCIHLISMKVFQKIAEIILERIETNQIQMDDERFASIRVDKVNINNYNYNNYNNNYNHFSSCYKGILIKCYLSQNKLPPKEEGCC